MRLAVPRSARLHAPVPLVLAVVFEWVPTVCEGDGVMACGVCRNWIPDWVADGGSYEPGCGHYVCAGCIERLAVHEDEDCLACRWRSDDEWGDDGGEA
jgi:hypothetical protein